MPYQEIAGRWKTALERFCKDRTPIPEEDKGHALEHKPSSQEYGRKQMDKITTMLGMGESHYEKMKADAEAQIEKTQPELEEQIAIAEAVSPLKSFKSIVGISLPTLAQKNRSQSV